MPKSVSLTFARPPGFEKLAHDAFVGRVKAALEVKEGTSAAIRQVAHRRVIADGGDALGALDPAPS